MRSTCEISVGTPRQIVGVGILALLALIFGVLLLIEHTKVNAQERELQLYANTLQVYREVEYQRALTNDTIEGTNVACVDTLAKLLDSLDITGGVAGSFLSSYRMHMRAVGGR
jgi:hypothetical protein